MSSEQKVKDAVKKLHQARTPQEKAKAATALHKATVEVRNENRKKGRGESASASPEKMPKAAPKKAATEGDRE